MVEISPKLKLCEHCEESIAKDVLVCIHCGGKDSNMRSHIAKNTMIALLLCAVLWLIVLFALPALFPTVWY